MWSFRCLWLAVAVAIRTDEEAVAIRIDEEESHELKASQLDLRRRLALNETGLQHFLDTGHIARQEEPIKLEQLPEAWKDRFKVVKELGNGAFGRIYELQTACGAGDHFVSLKYEEKSSDSFREVKHMRQMSDSKYVISTVGKPDYVETPTTMAIMMPFMNSGDFRNLMNKCVQTKGCRCTVSGVFRTCWEKLGPPYSKAFVLALFYQAVVGVQDLHRKGLVHMDIKLDNIMVNCEGENQRCSAKIIDLGIAAEFGTRMPSGTPGYMAPEVLKIKGSSLPQNDIFSLGVILYMFIYGEQPPFFRGGDSRNYDPAKDPTIPSTHQSELDQLVLGMLKNDHESRMDTPEILQRLMGTLITMPDTTGEVIEMFSGLISSSNYKDTLPHCLWEWEPPEKDVGEGPFHRQDCLDRSTEPSQPRKSKKRCLCHILRNGRRVSESFEAPECL